MAAPEDAEANLRLSADNTTMATDAATETLAALASLSISDSDQQENNKEEHEGEGMQLKADDDEGKTDDENAIRDGLDDQMGSVFTHKMQMMVLDPQDKKMSMAAQLEQARAQKPEPGPGPNSGLQDYQMQAMLLEQQNKRRLKLARMARTQEPGPELDRALMDYEMQLYSEQREEMRLMVAEVGLGPNVLAFQDFQMQLMLLEQQNKKRFMIARMEQEQGPREHSEVHTGSRL